MVGSKDGKVIQENKDIGLSIRETSRSSGFKKLPVLNSTEHKIYPVHKCKNCQQFNIYELK